MSDDIDEPLTEGAEDWSECASRLLAGTPQELRSSSEWTQSASLRSRLSKNDLEAMCEEFNADCSSARSKSAIWKALLKAQLGPDLPRGGVRMCHPGIAMGYDVELQNPAWCAYRLLPEEQRQTANDRKGFTLDPALRAAGIAQTNPSQYENTGFDKGHVAPSLAMSFQRKELMDMDRSPWKASYFASNIAPQYSKMNQRSWQELENALHEYAADLPKSSPGLFVVTGVGYWNRARPRTWQAQGECWVECPCQSECDCRTCEEDFVRVPTFYWKAVCEPSVVSFAAILENDPESSQLEGGQEGWPPSAFTTYPVDDLEKLLDLKVNFPEECFTDTAQLPIPTWNKEKKMPLIPAADKPGKLTIRLLHIGGTRVHYKEKVWIQFESAFGPAADFADALILEPPPPQSWFSSGWLAECTAMLIQQMPAIHHCSQQSTGAITLSFLRPQKGGTFIFKLALEAPSGPLMHSEWSARTTGGRLEAVAKGQGFNFVPAADVHDFFYENWMYLLAVGLLLLFGWIFCAVQGCRRGARERALEAALERERAQIRELNERLQRPTLPAAGGKGFGGRGFNPGTGWAGRGGGVEMRDFRR